MRNENENILFTVRVFLQICDFGSQTVYWFNAAETNCRIAHNLGILLMNSNYYAIFSAAL